MRMLAFIAFFCARLSSNNDERPGWINLVCASDLTAMSDTQ